MGVRDGDGEFVVENVSLIGLDSEFLDVVVDETCDGEVVVVCILDHDGRAYFVSGD